MYRTYLKDYSNINYLNKSFALLLKVIVEAIVTRVGGTFDFFFNDFFRLFNDKYCINYNKMSAPAQIK